MDKEKAKQEVEKIVKKFLSTSKSELDEMPEEQIKFRFIEPLFEALGWEREDIFKEKKILKGRADYILKIGNQDKLVIEAKKTDVRLSEDEGRQAVSYAHHKNIKFSVLTNFKQIRVYHALSNIKNIDRNLLKDDKGYLWIDCENFIEQFDRLWFLSRESFEKEDINKLLQNVDKKLIKPIDEVILADLLQYREWLSKDLKDKRTYLTDSQIDEIVQILIDRLIFMRSVEDRGLEEKEFLLKKVDDVQKGRTDKNLWALLAIQFRIFDKEYNSKLFSEGLLEKEGYFDDKTLMKVIKGLYDGTQDHQERYMFDEIPVDLLGSIYEQYLGVVLRGTEKRVKLDLLSGKRKSMGIYYTPSYIVDYIVKNAVGEYIKDKSIDEILNVKILDPACGSGSFLIRAFQEVCNAIEERLKKGEKSKKWSSFNSYNERLSIGQKATILTNCIYGVDLDEKAVELAQLNLLLKILEEETRETRKRVLPTMKDNIKNGNSLIDDYKIAGDKAFNWNAQFPDVFKQGGFDVVIGNPPYGAKFNDEEKDYLKKNYPYSDIEIESYILFIEKANSLLKERGYLGFIIPSNILTNVRYKKIRSFLLEKTTIKTLIDLGSNVFGEASVDSSILIFEKEVSKENKINTANYEFSPKDLTKINYNFFNQASFERNPSKIFNIYINKNMDSVLSRIENCSERLGDFVDISRGIELGYNSEFVADTKKNGKYEPLIAGRCLSRYNLLFNNKYILFDEKNKKIYKDREIYLKEKLLIRRIGHEIIGVYDDKGYYNVCDVYNILSKGKLSLKLLLGIINSKLISFYLKNKFKSAKKLFPKIPIENLLKIPIKLPDEKQAKKIKDLVDRIMKLYKEKSESQIVNVEYEIDEEIYKLYGIAEEEKKIIEESLK